MKAKRRIGLGLLVLLLLLSLATTVFASAEDPGTGEYIPEETTAPTEDTLSYPLDINAATAEDFTRLPGIGDTLAHSDT